MRFEARTSAWSRLQTAGGAVVLTMSGFLVLPLIQAIGKPPRPDTVVRPVEATVLEAPEAPEPPPRPEPEPEPPPPPQLEQAEPNLDLGQLELALNPGFGSGFLGTDLGARLGAAAAAETGSEAMFSLADLDQRPRPIHQPGPTLTPELRRKGGGTVEVMFMVDPRGRVQNPIAKTSTDPAYEPAALAAVRQWRFEPGKRSGQAVTFLMRVSVVFPGG